MRSTALASCVLLSLGCALAGCGSVGCLDGDPQCEVPSPCPDLQFTCDAGDTGYSEAYRLGTEDPPLQGSNVLAATGDYVLGNDKVVAVIDALDHPHYLAPSGGELIDLAPRATGVDALRASFQAAGLLPGEAALYDTARILDEGDVKAVQFTGHLDGHPEYVIATRYEIRPCEPGIRIRTELLNGGREPQSWLLGDAWWHGGREGLPFSPAPGVGFDYPSFGLTTVSDALRDVPYWVIGAHPSPATSYTSVACNQDRSNGFVSVEISDVGVGPDIVQPKDWRIYERFIGVAAGRSISGATDIALDVRRRLFGEPWTELTGHVVAPVGPSMVPTGERAAVLVSEGTADTPVSDRTPVTDVFPDADGSFAVRVPPDHDYVLDVEAYGRQVLEHDVGHVGPGGKDIGTLTLPAVGELTLNAAVDGHEDYVLAFIVPADDATREATTGRFLGNMEACAPVLDHPHGGSPACNRVLVHGPTTVSIPPGNYDVLAAAGPFSTLARVPDVAVVAGEGQSVEIDLQQLPVQPPGTISGDFHVHGGASYDSGIDDMDRVEAFLASGLQVIAATDHNASWDYAKAMRALHAYSRLKLLIGTESTGLILFNYIPAETTPKDVGHWNFWPTRFDPHGPYRGPPWDQKAQPGSLMERMQNQGGWNPTTGVVQLNHPLDTILLGRAYGWMDALDIDGTRPLRADYDGTAQATFLHRPKDDNDRPATFANSDYDTQEVMNGTKNAHFLQYRSFWFYLLNQGIVHAVTGNSDSHTLTESVVGTPRTIVWTSTTMDHFDPDVFDADVKAGHELATNGPIVEIAMKDADGVVHTPSIDAFTPPADPVLSIKVTAAPWIEVQQVRIFVNANLVDTIPVTDPADPMSTDPADFLRLDTTVDMAGMLPQGQDAWIAVEAGPPHRLAADLDCDGFPDTSDNNGDGVVDWRDVDGLTADPGVDCLSTVGPLNVREVPTDREDPLYWFGQIFPGGYPLAITNPLILDVDGDGFHPVFRPGFQ